MLPHNSLHTGMQIGSVEVPQVHHRWGWKRREETAKGIADSPWPFPGRCWGGRHSTEERGPTPTTVALPSTDSGLSLP